MLKTILIIQLAGITGLYLLRHNLMLTYNATSEIDENCIIQCWLKTCESTFQFSCS